MDNMASFGQYPSRIYPVTGYLEPGENLEFATLLLLAKICTVMSTWLQFFGIIKLSDGLQPHS
jgi:hypothetical protein